MSSAAYEWPQPKKNASAPMMINPRRSVPLASEEALKAKGPTVRTSRHRRHSAEASTSFEDIAPLPAHIRARSNTDIFDTNVQSNLNVKDRSVVLVGKLQFEQRVGHWKERSFILFGVSLSYVRRRQFNLFSDYIFNDLFILADVIEVAQDDTCFLIDEACFLIRTAKKTIYFKATSGQDAHEWVLAIRATVAAAKGITLSRSGSRSSSISSTRSVSPSSPMTMPPTRPPQHLMGRTQQVGATFVRSPGAGAAAGNPMTARKQSLPPVH